jgi:(E)-4-hydroxy-3-methylbut-2-enyl-diphosphate synthase
MSVKPYCNDLFISSRFQTREVKIGECYLGGENPIRIQSMTTADTMDTKRSVDECIRMIEAGCELVRLTAPSKKEAENLGVIRSELEKLGYTIPLVADIHFTPNAAEIAAKLIQKVRVNPGNYADKKKFEEIEYNDESYSAELIRIEEKFTPLIQICKDHNTAIRIGTNHGSLSDRILSRFGDTAEGMVASAFEFIDICIKNDFHDIVISMKASNTLVMVHAYRLFNAIMIERNLNYPLHLGVTEAGDGEDGRIKSAVGIGALLEDGLGDTIRVSLTEAPEKEIPVAKKLVSFQNDVYEEVLPIVEDLEIKYDPFGFERRTSKEIVNIGGKNVPVVINSLLLENQITPANLFAFGYRYNAVDDKWNIDETACDYIYTGNQIVNFELPGTLRIILDHTTWMEHKENKKYFPLITEESYKINPICSEILNFVHVEPGHSNLEWVNEINKSVVILSTHYSNSTQVLRFVRTIFDHLKNTIPVILKFTSLINEVEHFQLYTGSKAGIHFIDGFGDGLFLEGLVSRQVINSTAFGILQATRSRISKTEYISCPSCGRTLFDLEETTAKIRNHTSHLKGLKIGIMGCIVNGPGEMADADYGYVGTGPGKINLYKERNVVRRNIPEENAVQELIELIKEHGDWRDAII